MSARVRTRLATAADIPAIRDLHRASILELCANDYSTEQLRSWATLRSIERYQARIARGFFYVAEKKSQAVGFAELDPETGEVRAVYVHPASARAGVASGLLLALEDAARRNGLTRLRLASSLNAVPFYRARGFMVGAKGLHSLQDGATLECVHMTKDLRREHGGLSADRR